MKVIVVSGLPGSGKSTVAEAIARSLSLPVFSIDPIEAAMWRNGITKSQTGIAAYDIAAAEAGEQLRLGLSVVIDAVNPIEAARKTWRKLALDNNASLKIVEVICSDKDIHKMRIETRVRNIPGMPEVTWERVLERKREYEPWHDDHLTLDSLNDIENLTKEALEFIAA